MYKLEFEIPTLPPTTNSHGRVHWAVKAKIARDWKTLVVWAVGSKTPKKPLQKAKVTITRFSSAECDFDGLVSGGKHLLDGLIVARVIIDDKFSVIGQPNYQWEKAPPRKGKVAIKVEEI